MHAISFASHAICRAGVATLAARPQGSFPARHLANLVWAVAKLASRCKVARKAAASDAHVVALVRAAGADMLCTPTRLDEFNGRDLSNAAWAFLTLGLFEPEVQSPACNLPHAISRVQSPACKALGRDPLSL